MNGNTIQILIAMVIYITNLRVTYFPKAKLD